MIDRDARDRLAELLERMLRGELRSAGYEINPDYRRFPKCDDPGVVKIYQAFEDYRNEEGIWRENLAVDGSTLDQLHDQVRRAIRFLRTDLEYEWPDIRFGESTDMSIAFVGVTVVATVIASVADFRSNWIWVGVFVFGMAATIIYRVMLSQFGAKGFAGAARRQRRKGRELEAWPFTHVADDSMEHLR